MDASSPALPETHSRPYGAFWNKYSCMVGPRPSGGTVVFPLL
jgi:hypothetical protein